MFAALVALQDKINKKEKRKKEDKEHVGKLHYNPKRRKGGSFPSFPPSFFSHHINHILLKNQSNFD